MVKLHVFVEPVMLFLINDKVIDVGDAAATAAKLGHLISNVPSFQLTAVEAVEIGRELFFQADDVRPRLELLIALAALLGDKTDANAALFVRPAKARSRTDVQFRIVDAPITTLAYLMQLQKEGALPPKVINESIWEHAA
ncbi:MAG: hypothetical protein CME88_07725 [Hirschia sp.]|nr:hypothetical protein [Hirschia sp.]MBF18248.1 hypothetical protein [Hirschia sp.]|tara:strand:- start:32 stop:451 length:420 start_codon:yes stop_codon:yes gene_type:complete